MALSRATLLPQVDRGIKETIQIVFLKLGNIHSTIFYLYSLYLTDNFIINIFQYSSDLVTLNGLSNAMFDVWGRLTLIFGFSLLGYTYINDYYSQNIEY